MNNQRVRSEPDNREASSLRRKQWDVAGTAGPTSERFGGSEGTFGSGGTKTR